MIWPQNFQHGFLPLSPTHSSTALPTPSLLLGRSTSGPLDMLFSPPGLFISHFFWIPHSLHVFAPEKPLQCTLFKMAALHPYPFSAVLLSSSSPLNSILFIMILLVVCLA